MKLTTAFILLALAAGGPRLIAADVQAGQAAYQRACKTCHGAQGDGNAAIAKALKVTIPELGSKEVQSKSDATLKKEITEGVGKMQPVKTLSGGELSGVIAFVRTLAKK